MHTVNYQNMDKEQKALIVNIFSNWSEAKNGIAAFWILWKYIQRKARHSSGTSLSVN